MWSTGRCPLPELEDRIQELEEEIGRIKRRFPSNAEQTADDGHVHYASPPACRVYNSANISIGNASDTALTFDTERFDNKGMHSTASNTGRITIKTRGRYWVGGHVTWAANTTGRRVVYIRVNGSTNIGSQGTHPGTANAYDQTVSTIYDFSKNDYVELVVYQNSGGALNVTAAGNNSPEFSAFRLGASGGSAGPIAGTDHGALTGLTDNADHPGYLVRDGTRSLTGNLSVNSGVTIDGVDLDAHVADVNAHHSSTAGGVTDHQELTNRDNVFAHTQYTYRAAEEILLQPWHFRAGNLYLERAAPSNPVEDELHLYAREKPTDATKIELVFITSQGDVVVLGEGDDSPPVAHTNILTLNWLE